MTERLQVVTAERVVPAPMNEVFDLLCDPAMHPVLDGSGTVGRSLPSNPRRLRLGSRFDMAMKLGPVPYRTRNTVVEFEANHLIAWCHVGRHRWRWELEPAPDGGTHVRASFDWSTGRSPKALEVLGVPDRNERALHRSLDRLATHLGEGAGA